MPCGFNQLIQLREEDISRVLESVPVPPGIHSEIPMKAVNPLKGVREAAVLVPLVCLEGVWNLVYTVRTESVQDHKGQVAFPGGAVEPSDIDRKATAFREAWEEIGLQPSDITFLGYLEDMVTVSGYLITPVVGVIPWPYPFIKSQEEVKKVFTIPLEWVADKTHWEEQSLRSMEGKETRQAIFFQPYDGELLWGITARISVILAERLIQGSA